MKLRQNEHGYYEVTVKGVGGKRHSISTRKKNRDEAKRSVKAARLAEIEKVAELGILSQDVVSLILTGRKATVANSIEPWKNWLRTQNQSARSIESAASWVMSWARAMGTLDVPIASIKADKLHDWINAPASRNKASTRLVMLSALRSFYRFVSAQGWVIGNPAALVKVDRSILEHEQNEVLRRPAFTDEEVVHLLEATADTGEYPSRFWHFAIAASRCLGLRLGDICRLEWACVSAETGSLIVWTEKRDKRVQPPIMEPEGAPGCWLRAVGQVEPVSEKLLFPTEASIHNDPAVRSTLSVQFRRLCDKLGLEGRTFHCLRASYCTACNRAGVPIEHIARHVGHSDTGTTEGYIR